jgi:hypothetical protein
MKLFWIGSDALFMHEYPPGIRLRYKLKLFIFRRIVRLMQFFINENYVVSSLQEEELQALGFKRIKIFRDQIKYSEPFPKIPHNGFNILFYHPSSKNPKFTEWLYGFDLYSDIVNALKWIADIKWIEVDGSQDMAKIYLITDFYLRCNRHDGHPRMIDECKINNIPYYWSQRFPQKKLAIKNILKAYHASKALRVNQKN